MPEFSSIKTITHRFIVDNNEVESDIGYDIIIARNLMVQLGLSDEFKRQFLQWGGNTVPMKEPSGLLGQANINSCNI